VIEWLIASGRDLGDIDKNGESYTALDAARTRGTRGVVSLLKRFMNNPAPTRHEVRVKLGMLDARAAEVFALTVFLCDGLLQLKPASRIVAPNPAGADANVGAATARFFTIAAKLPMEQQMIMCHRAQ